MRRILEWNGRDLPEVLRQLQPGRYFVEAEPACSEAEQDELRKLAARCADSYVCE